MNEYFLVGTKEKMKKEKSGNDPNPGTPNPKDGAK